MGQAWTLKARGPQLELSLVLGENPIWIGSSTDSDVQLPDTEATAPYHCVVEGTYEECLLRDLGTRQGLVVNGRRTRRHPLRPGDRFQIGQVAFVLDDGTGQFEPQLQPVSTGRHARPRGRPFRRPRRPGRPLRAQPLPPQGAPAPEYAPPASPEYASPEYASPEPAPPASPEYSAPPSPEYSAPASPEYSSPEPSPVTELAATAPATVSVGSSGELRADGAMDGLMDHLLSDARQRGASDLHLVVGSAVTFRTNGDLEREGPKLDEVQLEGLAYQITTPAQRQQLVQTGDLDYCYQVEGKRYRTNICKDRRGLSITARVIKPHVATLRELGVPEAAQRMTTFAQGLVLITGPLGAGKTTTMMALVDLVNRDRKDHIITIEDPIEFLLPPAQCQISQRELGSHTDSFDAALRAALREDPDIIVIGDLRDYQTASLAISAAETGHLVFASMPSMNAMKTLDKLIDMFPAGEQNSIRTMVSESLRGILCQRLLPGVDGQRVLAVELLFNSIAVGNIIREGKTAGLRNAMQMGKSQGMQTLDTAVHDLLNQGVINQATADAALKA